MSAGNAGPGVALALVATLVPAGCQECLVHPFHDDRFIAPNGTIGLALLDLPPFASVAGAA